MIIDNLPVVSHSPARYAIATLRDYSIPPDKDHVMYDCGPECDCKGDVNRRDFLKIGVTTAGLLAGAGVGSRSAEAAEPVTFRRSVGGRRGRSGSSSCTSPAAHRLHRREPAEHHLPARRHRHGHGLAGRLGPAGQLADLQQHPEGLAGRRHVLRRPHRAGRLAADRPRAAGCPGRSRSRASRTSRFAANTRSPR